MSLRDKPHYKLAADTIADWIERQPDKWWSVDGDPLLGSVVDFPCPSDELGPAIRRVRKNLLLRSNRPCALAQGQVITIDHLDAMADTNNRNHKKTFLLSWEDSDVDWLLIEDEALVPR